MDIAEKFQKIGVVPVVVLEDVKDAVPLAKALVEGGLPCAEVTFRTEAAEESIRLMAEQFPDMLVGAGTVLTKEQVDAAAAAGAKFIVSPGFDPEIVDYCLEKEIPVYPGCVSPSEVAQAVKRGLKVVKFFPAEPAGGLPMIKAMAAPYVGLKFMPTGGINAKNLEEYLSCFYPKIIGVNTHIHIQKKAEPGSNAEFCFLLQRKRELDNFSNSYIINNGNYQR